MKRYRVGIDMDGILVDTHRPILDICNREFKTNMQIMDMTHFGWAACMPEGMDKFIREWMADPRSMREVPPMEGAVEGVKALVEMGFEPWIVTAPARKHHVSASSKLHWVENFLPMVNMRNVVITDNKHVVNVNYHIDDSPKKLLKHREEWPETKLITIDYLYNRGVEVDHRAIDGGKPKEAWSSIIEYFAKEISR